jgi:hypothetical protein
MNSKRFGSITELGRLRESWRVYLLVSQCYSLHFKAFFSLNPSKTTQTQSKGVTTVEINRGKLFLKFALSLRKFNVDSLF